MTYISKLILTSLSVCFINNCIAQWKNDSTNEAIITELVNKMTPQEKVLQLLSYVSNGVPRLGIPNLQAGEALHGVVTNGATVFPQSIALAATWSPDLVEKMGVVIGQEARAVGIQQAFAPMLGLARDPRWGRIEESYGEDSYLATMMGVAYVNGIQGKGKEQFGPEKIIATPKHFIADGEPWGGHNGEYFEVSDRVLREIYLPPFQAVVKEAQAGSIMPAHHQLNGIPCHANHWLLDTLLRQEWGFKGFITSDMGDIPKLNSGHKYAAYGDTDPAIMALKAGVDMELIGKVYKKLLENVKERKLSQEVIDQSVKRVLRLKIKLLGLAPANSTTTVAAQNETSNAIKNYTGPDDIWAKLVEQGKFTTPESAKKPNYKEIISNPSHDSLALTLAQKSIVLLKNKNNLLPLDKNKIKTILVVGPLANTVNLGGYSGSSNKPSITAFNGIKNLAGNAVTVLYQPGCEMEDTSTNLLAKALNQSQKVDVIVAVVGHSRKQVGENLDRDNLDLVGGQEKLVEALYYTGKPVIVIIENGAPVSINWIKDSIPAIMECLYGGQNAGTAIAQALFGDINPGGKLPFSVPKNLGQIPCYYNYLPITGPSDYYQSKWKNLFVFGEGISYTNFKYSNLKVTPKAIKKGEIASITVSIKNIGKVTGDEVVQLYVRQDYTSMVRPVKTLRGFSRITLKEGEEKEINFKVGYEDVKFWKNNGWTAEAGQLNLLIGSSSEDIRLKGTLQLDY